MTTHQNVNFQSFFKEIRLIHLPFDNMMLQNGSKNKSITTQKRIKDKFTLTLLILFFIFYPFCKKRNFVEREMHKLIETKLSSKLLSL